MVAVTTGWLLLLLSKTSNNEWESRQGDDVAGGRGEGSLFGAVNNKVNLLMLL